MRHFHTWGQKFIQINFGCCCCSFQQLTSPNQDFQFCFIFTFMVAFGCRGVKLDYKALAHQAVVMRRQASKKSHSSHSPAACVSVWTANQMTAGINLQALHNYIYCWTQLSCEAPDVNYVASVFKKAPHTFVEKTILERSGHNQFGPRLGCGCGFLTYGQTGQKQAYLNYFCLRNYASQLNYGLSEHLAKILLTWNSLCVGALVFKSAQGQR